MTPFTHVIMPHRWRMSLGSALICLGVSMLLAAAKVAIHGGFGATDLIPFFIWTIPLSFMVGFTKKDLVEALRPRPMFLVSALSLATGIVVGLFWTYFVAFWIGPYFGAFSFAVLSCWVVGAASGFVATSTYHRDSRQSFTMSLVIVGAISLLGLVAEGPLFRLLVPSQELEVIGVKWKPGTQPLSSPPVLGVKLSDADLDRLRSIGLTGQVEFASSGIFGQGKRSKAIIIFSQPLSHPVTLPQPDGGQIVYLQTPEGWKVYPSNAVTLKKNIQLLADEKEPNRATQYYVETPGGARQGGTLLTW